LCLGAGVLLPLTVPTGEATLVGIKFLSGAQAAIAALLLGGLLIGLNQVFLVTSTWARYATAMLRIGSLIRLLEWDWKIMAGGLKEDVSVDEAKRARELFRAAVADSAKITESETTAWSGELSKAIENLAALIKDQRGAVESQLKELQKAQEEARKAAEQAKQEQEKAAEVARKAAVPPPDGAVKIKFEGAVNRLQGTVKAALSGKEQVSDAKQLSFAFLDVTPGLKELVVSGQDTNGTPIVLRTVVEAASGKVAEVSVAIPGA
jgi:gas vesicle protein